MKKSAQGRQTLRANCSKAEPKKFRPAADPLTGARDGQNLISWRWSLSLPTNRVWWGSMHAISSYRGNKPTTQPQTHTHTHTHTQTDRTDYNYECLYVTGLYAILCNLISGPIGVIWVKDSNQFYLLGRWQLVPNVWYDEPASLILNLLNSISIDFDSMLKTSLLCQVSSHCDQGFSFYRANIYPHQNPHIQPHNTPTYIMAKWSKYRWRIGQFWAVCTTLLTC